MPSLLGSSLKVPKRNDLAVPIQHVEDTDVVVFSPLFLTLGVHVQRGLRYLVCVSVCVSTLILALQARKRLMSDTNIFSDTSAQKVNWRFC